MIGKIYSKSQKFIFYTTVTVFSLISLYLFFMGAFEWPSSGCVAFKNMPLILRGICAVGMIFLLAMVYTLIGRGLEKISEKSLKRIAFIGWGIMIILQVTFVLSAKAGIRYDSLNVVDEAIALFSQPGMQVDDLDGYFARYSNNYAMTIMTHWWIKIFRIIGIIKEDFSNAVLVLQLINVLFIDVAFGGCQLFIKRYFGKVRGVMFLLYMLFNPLTYVWLPFYYTNTCSMAFTVWGIYLLYTVFDSNVPLNFKEKDTIKNILQIILAGMLFYFGYKIRATVLIGLIAAVIGLYCRRVSMNLKGLLLIVLCFSLSMGATKVAYTKLEDHYLAFDETDTAFPITHWIAMGLYEPGRGAYFDGDEKRTKSFPTALEKKEATVSLIKERAKDLGPVGIGKLYMKKLSDTFGDGAGGYHSELIISQDYGRLWQNVYGVHRDPLMMGIQVFYLMSIFCCLSVVWSLGKKRLSEEAFVLVLLLTGSYLFQMLWESATIYSIGTMYLNGCMAALGISLRNQKNPSKSQDQNFLPAKICKAAILSYGILGLIVIGIYFGKTNYVEMTVSVDQFLFQAKEYPALSEGQCITQTFHSDKEFSHILLEVRNFTEEANDSIYTVTLCDKNGTLLQEQELIAANETDYHFSPLEFHNEKDITEYEIQIRKKSGHEDLIFLYYDTGHYDAYPQGQMTGPMVKGKLADLVFEVYQREED